MTLRRAAGLRSNQVSIQSISFWQQDQNYWNQSQSRDQSLANSAALINVMGSAMTNLATGLAGIANQTALDRVNSQITTTLQSALQSVTGSSGSSSSNSTGTTTSSTSSGSSGSGTSSGAPASGTGTVPVSTNTSLLTLGILAQGSITVSDGTNTTTYTSTGTDTVSDLINAINTNAFGNANVAAGLDGTGKLVFTAEDNTDTVTVGGEYAANIGFGAGNNTFQPTSPAPSPAATPSTSGTSGTSISATSSSASTSSPTGSSTGSSTTTSAGSSSGSLLNSAYALQTGGTAELLLASNSSVGTLFDLLA